MRAINLTPRADPVPETTIISLSADLLLCTIADCLALHVSNLQSVSDKISIALRKEAR